jgi:hypothetical protein
LLDAVFLFGFFGHEFARENGILPRFHFTLLGNASVFSFWRNWQIAAPLCLPSENNEIAIYQLSRHA